jgi:hypothetical protein
MPRLVRNEVIDLALIRVTVFALEVEVRRVTLLNA